MQAHVAVKAVILNHNMKRALLIQRSPDDFGGWEGAGGSVEEGETLKEAIIREVSEETGLTVVPERVLYASLGEVCGKKVIFVVFLCSTTQDTIVLSSEHIDYRWVDKAECEAMLPDGIAKEFREHGVYELEW